MIWVLAGTQDGREIASALASKRKETVLVTVVSEYGKKLAELPNVKVLVGSLDGAAMRDVIKQYHITFLVDASHPYALQVTDTARQACMELATTYVRYERPPVPLPDYDKLVVVSSAEAAAEAASALGQVVFLTTGSRTLAVFAQSPALKNHRLIARVLPDAAVIGECQALGFTPKDIVALQGPFSEELNCALFQQYEADVIIMKNSGVIGGSDSKLAAAMKLQLAVVVIERQMTSARENLSVFSEIEPLVAYINQCKKN